ncbi:MAG: transposase, partial [Planctomycetes bacterium]|nr:transposase [Planctomycetota bacterium]
ADWGVKTYRGEDENGKAWDKAVRWFGYKLHLLVDSVYELPLSFRLTQASAGDSPELLDRVADLEAHHPDRAKRAQELSADKAYDSFENNRALYDRYGIKPLIDIRAAWPDETGTKALVPGRADVFVYPGNAKDAGEGLLGSRRHARHGAGPPPGEPTRPDPVPSRACRPCDGVKAPHWKRGLSLVSTRRTRKTSARRGREPDEAAFGEVGGAPSAGAEAAER